jgi:hypothetical protein
VAPHLLKDFPQMETAARLRRQGPNLRYGEDPHRLGEGRLAFADSAFFQMFTFPVEAGDGFLTLSYQFDVFQQAWRVAGRYRLFDRENNHPQSIALLQKMLPWFGMWKVKFHMKPRRTCK